MKNRRNGFEEKQKHAKRLFTGQGVFTPNSEGKMVSKRQRRRIDVSRKFNQRLKRYDKRRKINTVRNNR